MAAERGGCCAADAPFLEALVVLAQVVGAVGLGLVSIVETASGDLRFMLLSAVALLDPVAVAATYVDS